MLSYIESDDDLTPLVDADGLAPLVVAYLLVHVDSLVEYMDQDRIENMVPNLAP